MENNDELQAKYEEYQVVLDDTMKENGFNASAVIERLNVIVYKAQSGKLHQKTKRNCAKSTNSMHKSFKPHSKRQWK
jgi:hypothetical protein